MYCIQDVLNAQDDYDKTEQKLNARKRFLKLILTSVSPRPKQVLKLKQEIRELETELSFCQAIYKDLKHKYEREHKIII